MKIYLWVFLVVFSACTVQAQLAFEDFNKGVLPAGWVLIGDGHTVLTGFALDTPLTKSAWIPYDMYANGDFSMITTSLSTPPAKADRWLISPPFKVNTTSDYLKWDDWNFSSGERVQILVSPSAGTTKSSFTSIIYDDTSTGFLATHIASLAAFNGQTIRVAFRDTMTNNYYFMVDNVQSLTMRADEMALSGIHPGAGSLLSYGHVGDTRIVSGTVTNNGLHTIYGYTTKYQLGTGPIQSEGHVANLSSFTTGSFTFAVPLNFPASPSDLKVWVELPGDTLHSNDTLYAYLSTYTTKPKKKPLIEEATGTWCGHCVRGIVYLDSIHQAYGDQLSLVAIHTRDPMLPLEYGVYINSVIPSYPAIVVDRVNHFDPNQIFTAYADDTSNFGVADIALNYYWTGNQLQVKAQLTPTVNTKADYRLALVLTEDAVAKNELYWAQHNIYSGGGMGPMQNKKYDFAVLPDPVPADSMQYDFVARWIYPSVSGAAASLPFAMTAGKTYTYAFPPIDIDTNAWKPARLKAHVLFIAQSDGTVLNTQQILCAPKPLAIAPTSSILKVFGIYPNPAHDMLHVQLALHEKEVLQFEIQTIEGRVLQRFSAQAYAAGTHDIPLALMPLTPAVYLLSVKTATSTLTKSFSVAP
jgi:thiol-disulfide isomerase/thioredoxin